MRSDPEPKACEFCGGPIPLAPHAVYAKLKFCSRSCAGRGQAAKIKGANGRRRKAVIR